MRLPTYRPGGLLIALGLLAVVAVTSGLSWQQYVRFAESTKRTNQEIGLLNEAVTSVREAESSQRGYLLTADRQYLAEYARAVATAQHDTRTLRSWATDLRAQPLAASLQTAVDAKVKELAATLDLAFHGDPARAIDVVKSNCGLQWMNRIRALSGDLDQYLESALQTNRENSRFYARLSQYVSILGCTGIFVIIYLANSRIVGLMAAATRANAELSRVNIDLKQFVFSASHDLQEPLRTLNIYSQLAAKKAAERRPFVEELGYVQQAATLMMEIVQDLLLYTEAANNASDGPASANVNDVLDTVLNVLAVRIQELGAKITYQSLPVLPISKIHAQILIQNLLTNALKYRSNDRSPEIAISVRRDAGNWVMAVTDNGLGIAPEYHEQIFGLFKRLHSRSDYPGTGLGLAICKKIVERYQGSISVKSQLGLGATFLVTLPART